MHMTSPWIQHLRDHAATHGLTYAQALKDPRAKASYARTQRGGCGSCSAMKGRGQGSSRAMPATAEEVAKAEADFRAEMDSKQMKSKARLSNRLSARHGGMRGTARVVPPEASGAAEVAPAPAPMPPAPPSAKEEVRAAEGTGLRAIARKMHGKGMPMPLPPAPRGFHWAQVLVADLAPMTSAGNAESSH